MKLLIIDNNKKYVERLTNALQKKYENRYDIYSISSSPGAEDKIKDLCPDIVLVDEKIGSVNERMLAMISAFLVSDSKVEKVGEKRAICKYKSVDEIHKDILSIYADSSNKVVSHSESSKGEMIVFTSPAGGTGCSTIAAACSIHCAKAGKKTLYLNLNPFDNPEIWFSGNGKTGMSDLVYAVKSRNSNFSVKVESCLRKSEEGVFFFGEC